MLDILYSPVKTAEPVGIHSNTPATIENITNVNPVLKGFKERFYKPPQQGTWKPRQTEQEQVLSSLNTSEIQDTGIDFMSKLCNDDFNERKMVKLVEQIEK